MPIESTQSVADANLVLNTIAMSHYSEKIRWLLDYEQISYREAARTPVYHSFPALIKGKRGQTTVPFIYRGKTCIQDSPRIVKWLGKEYGPLQTLPERYYDEIMDVASRFDAIGKGVARYLYYPGFEHKALILDMWTRFATPREAKVIRAIYPIVKPIFKAKLKINATDVARAEIKIDEAVQWLEQRIATTGTYLVGDQFTVADITAASLLAPLACPKEHPIYGSAEFRDKMAPTSALWKDRPGLEWVRSIYTKHRGTVWQEQPKAA